MQELFAIKKTTPVSEATPTGVSYRVGVLPLKRSVAKESFNEQFFA